MDISIFQRDPVCRAALYLMSEAVHPTGALETIKEHIAKFGKPPGSLHRAVLDEIYAGKDRSVEFEVDDSIFPGYSTITAWNSDEQLTTTVGIARVGDLGRGSHFPNSKRERSSKQNYEKGRWLIRRSDLKQYIDSRKLKQPVF